MVRLATVEIEHQKKLDIFNLTQRSLNLFNPW